MFCEKLTVYRPFGRREGARHCNNRRSTVNGKHFIIYGRKTDNYFGAIGVR